MDSAESDLSNKTPGLVMSGHSRDRLEKLQFTVMNIPLVSHSETRSDELIKLLLQSELPEKEPGMKVYQVTHACKMNYWSRNTTK
ncbi:hypothetical protein MHYP_G00174240 [Metynnis hypsauchen]